MTLPELIPIAYEADYRTDTIGRYDDGQFYANGWDHHAFVHFFDHDGTYRESTVVRVEHRRDLERVVGELVAAIPGRTFGDIAVGLFEFERDGVRFGLVDESAERDDAWAELYPDRLGFTEPWDGLYST
ncbi:hypothetical protein [Actinoplanes sp. G11-F43]|uniref:hypothetical protein n=1 Tax=Actinoplanes sp. G11-F43 TaxID=3424130 RepID=UPI003D339D09